MLSCKEATRLESDAMERPLSVVERLQLRVHIMICAGCRRAQKQFNFLRTAARAWRPDRD